MYNISDIRKDFPILGREVYGKPLVYLDNGATTQKPRQVVDAITEEYYSVNANVHRGVHFLSQEATRLHEASRERVRSFINASSTSEIIFTRGTTEAINLLAYSFGEAFLHEGDEVIVSTMEHHSNIVPWQLLEQRKGIRLRVIPITDRGEICLDEYKALFNDHTRLVSVMHVSNVLGTVNPIREMIRIAHEHEVPFAVDGAQGVPHLKVDVQELDADFYAFSAHKIYGPTGIGVLYGKERWLDRMPPYQGGGEMIQTVSFERTTFNELPYKFEAGTPDYIGTTAFARALDYVSALGIEHIAAHEKALTDYALQRLREIPEMRIIGEAEERGAVISFNVGDIHPSDLGTLLDRLGIAVRTGHHCAQPLMQRMGIPGTVRASFALYNTMEEVDALVAAVDRVRKMF
ncbi:MAG: cysteine desulfurase [Bacteroidaceae bacterium]|nr:cysteine desulfurase [Bacteroidaceae bacterium]MBR5842550.1 cysteine desulfurase [Bacteroidaceae bacterium]